MHSRMDQSIRCRLSSCKIQVSTSVNHFKECGGIRRHNCGAHAKRKLTASKRGKCFEWWLYETNWKNLQIHELYNKCKIPRKLS